MQWYSTIQKPFFAPPAEIFGPVWMVLYVLIVVSFGFVFFKVFTRQWPLKIAIPFVINLIANLSFSPVQFVLQNFFLASIIVLITWMSIVWIIYIMWNKQRWIAYAQVPYLLWVSFATVLQLSITWLNW